MYEVGREVAEASFSCLTCGRLFVLSKGELGMDLYFNAIASLMLILLFTGYGDVNVSFVFLLMSSIFEF